LFAPLSATNASRHRNSPHQSSMLRGTRRAGIKNNRQSGRTMQPCTSSHRILIYLSGPAPLVISPMLSHSA